MGTLAKLIFALCASSGGEEAKLKCFDYYVNCAIQADSTWTQRGLDTCEAAREKMEPKMRKEWDKE